jgi:hypothetical protein
MQIGDLVWIVSDYDNDVVGHGLYLGIGTRGELWKEVYEFLWLGRIATFDKPYWRFEVINDRIDQHGC